MARLYDGSISIGQRARKWPWEQPDWPSRARRVAWYAFLGFSLYQIAERMPRLMWIVVAGWLIVAYREPLETSEKPPAAESADERQDDEDETGSGIEDELTPAEFLHTLRALIGDTAGVHLAQVAEHLTGNPKDTALVRSLCARAGVPVAGGVRVPGRAVSTGVRRGDLPPASPPGPAADGAPVVAVVDAGQAEQQQQQQQPTARIVPDPDGTPNRWKVEWEK